MFFFEKKNQKTFIRLIGGGEASSWLPLLASLRPRLNGQSLFASFSSEKEESL
jgi:hypothetical protein